MALNPALHTRASIAQHPCGLVPCGQAAELLQLTTSMDGLYSEIVMITALLGQGKCRKVAVPATVPGTKAQEATVGDHGKARVGNPGARRPDPESCKFTFATGYCWGYRYVYAIPILRYGESGFFCLGQCLRQVKR